MLIDSAFTYRECQTHPGWGFHEQAVGFTRIYYILGGTAFYRDEERQLPLRRGYLYLLPANRPYSLWEEPGDKLVHTYVHVFTDPPLTQPIELDCEKEGLPGELVALLRRYVGQREQSAVDALVKAIFSYAETLYPLSDRLSDRVKAYLDSAPERPYDPDVLSHTFGYSHSHLSRVFRADFQVTPRQYRERRRFEYAAERLRSGISCKEVASELSYSSAANFSRDFKKRYGLSPRQYPESMEERER